MTEIGRPIHDDVIRLEGLRASEVFREVFAYHTVRPQSLDAAVAAPALGLPHADPFDRLIFAAAREVRVPLITKDANITDSALLRVICWIFSLALTGVGRRQLSSQDGIFIPAFAVRAVRNGDRSRRSWPAS